MSTQQTAHKAQKENRMKHYVALSNQATRRMLPSACATALAVAFTVSLSAHAGQVTPPPVPPNLQVQAGNKAFLEGHGVGTQNYVCAPSASSLSGVAYALFTPKATLFNEVWRASPRRSSPAKVANAIEGSARQSESDRTAGNS